MSAAGVIVITHGNAAEDMVDAVERVVGKLNVRTISVRIGEPRAETESRLESVVDELHADEVLFLTDLEGSTPYNLCCKRCGGASVVLSVPVKSNRRNTGGVPFLPGLALSQSATAFSAAS